METTSCNEHLCGDEAIFISGGYGTLESTEVLDLESSHCSITTALLDCGYRYGFSSHVLNNSLVICGGHGGITATECMVSSAPAGAWSMENGAWRDHSTLTGERSFHSGAV